MLEAAALGATLYVPSTRADLVEVLLRGRHPDLRSAIVCLEDSVRADQVPAALLQLSRFLSILDAEPSGRSRPALFVRPRSAEMLRTVVNMQGAERLDGFVMPKATAAMMPAWLDALTCDHHRLMPTVETVAAFEPAEIRRLRRSLLAARERILVIRIGGNDLLQLLGARRSSCRTAYDGPLGTVIAQLVCAFAPFGFALSAPVLENFGHANLLRREVERDLEHGLLTKTAIHPVQIEVIQNAYAVSPADLASARAVLSDRANAVFAQDGVMSEPATHVRWARGIVARAEAFGLIAEPSRAQPQPHGGVALVRSQS